MGFEVIAYTLIVSSGTGIVYVVLIVFETARGSRLASRPRSYLDRQLLGVSRGAQAYGGVAVDLYMRGSSVVKNDVLCVLAQPFFSTLARYRMVKTGKLSIRRRPIRSISPYLQKLLEKRG